jgi:hypothetical protein
MVDSTGGPRAPVLILELMFVGPVLGGCCGHSAAAFPKPCRESSGPIAAVTLDSSWQHGRRSVKMCEAVVFSNRSSCIVSLTEDTIPGDWPALRWPPVNPVSLPPPTQPGHPFLIILASRERLPIARLRATSTEVGKSEFTGRFSAA